MTQIINGRLSDPHFAARCADPMYRLRYRVFYERLRWEVKVSDGLEIDQFDDAQSIYQLVADTRGAIVGGWRLRPTTLPYMMKDVFPQLMGGAAAPVQADVWEISRFAVDEQDGAESGFGLNDTARALVRHAIQFAVDHDISQYVMVVSVAVERLLANTGMVIQRYAPPQRVGRVRSVACFLDIDAHTRHVILGHPLPLRNAA
jgi:acyl homoserine lactone synthase